MGVMRHITGGYLDARTRFLTVAVAAAAAIIIVIIIGAVVGIVVEHRLLLGIVPTADRTDRVAVDERYRWHIGRHVVHCQGLHRWPIAYQIARMVEMVLAAPNVRAAKGAVVAVQGKRRRL